MNTVPKFAGSFPLGRIVVSNGLFYHIKDSPRLEAFMMECLKRHTRQDWGDLDAEDRNHNQWSLNNGERILSSYNIPATCPETRDGKLWIITERDRSYTTLLFPSDY
jgi:hypothetical protein